MRMKKLTKRKFKQNLKEIDEEIKRKKIKFTTEEAVRDDLYD